LYRTGGLRSANLGFTATLGRDAVASFFYFSSYEYLKAKFTPEGAEKPGVMGILNAGGAAGNKCKNRFTSSLVCFTLCFLTRSRSRVNNFIRLLFCSYTGILNWAAALPIDTLKSKLQIAPLGQYPNGIRSVFKEGKYHFR
jgi:hypothetical protein